MSWKTALGLLGLLLVLSACSPSRSSSDDDDDDSNDNWTLDIVNDSGITLAIAFHRPCPSEDPEDWNEIPLPAGGIASGDNHRVSLPTPSCYALSAEDADGACFVQGTTGSLQLGDQTTWTITDVDLTCAG